MGSIQTFSSGRDSLNIFEVLLETDGFQVETRGPSDIKKKSQILWAPNYSLHTTEEQ